MHRHPFTIKASLVAARSPAPGHALVTAYVTALPPSFPYLVPVLGAGFLLSFLLAEKRLRMTTGPELPAAADPAPADGRERTDSRPSLTDVLLGSPVPAAVPSGQPLMAAHPSPQPARTPSGQPQVPAAGGTLPAAPAGPAVLPALVPGQAPAPGPRRAAGPDAPVSGGPPVRGYVRRADGSAVAGATVTLIDRAGRQASRCRSESDGSYRLQAPGAGPYTLVAVAASHQPYASMVMVGAQPADVDALLPAAGSLAGTVRAAGSRVPVPGATASLADSAGEIVAAGATDPAGRYLLGDLPAGRYTLAVSARSCQPAALPVVIAAGSQATQDAELAFGGRLEGAARNTLGAAVPDTRVTVLDAAGNVTAVTTTSADGTYSVENLAAGEYTVIAVGYPPVASTLRLTPGQAHAHNLRLGHPDA